MANNDDYYHLSNLLRLVTVKCICIHCLFQSTYLITTVPISQKIKLML